MIKIRIKEAYLALQPLFSEFIHNYAFGEHPTRVSDSVPVQSIPSLELVKW